MAGHQCAYVVSCAKTTGCRSMKSLVDLTQGLHVHFIDHLRTNEHHTLVFGLREMNAADRAAHCNDTAPVLRSSAIVFPSNFTSDYELQIFTTACHFLDSHHNWKSDGVRVG